MNPKGSVTLPVGSFARGYKHGFSGHPQCREGMASSSYRAGYEDGAHDRQLCDREDHRTRVEWCGSKPSTKTAVWYNTVFSRNGAKKKAEFARQVS